jgi:zinc/manganese transport system permease protein
MRGEPTLTWNLAHDASEVLEYHFMVNALAAGSAVAVAAALLGWFTIVRRAAFTAHTLAMMAVPGAAAAALAGVSAGWGYLSFCVAGALGIARLPGAGSTARRDEDAAVGVVQALALALGFLFVSLYGGVLGDLESLLFGNLLGVSDGEVRQLAVVAVCVACALLAIGRPLLLASIDPQGAEARGVPVGRLSLAYLVLLGLAVAATSQVTGPLLVFSLLVMPAAAAQALTPRPLVGLALSVGLALVVVWVGLGLAYFSVYPPGFWVATCSFAAYLLARLAAGGRRARLGRRGMRTAAAVGAS